MEETRGKIIHRGYAIQVRDFSGLRYRNITPTDIDALIDFANKAFIFIEVKHGEIRLPFGQRLALERLVDNLEKAGKLSFALIASHNTDKDIDFAKCIVKECRYKRRWTNIKEEITVKQAIDKFLRRYLPEYISEK